MRDPIERIVSDWMQVTAKRKALGLEPLKGPVPQFPKISSKKCQTLGLKTLPISILNFLGMWPISFQTLRYFWVK